MDISPPSAGLQAPPSGRRDHLRTWKGRWSTRSRAKTPTTLNAGDVLFVPAETIHAVRNVGSGNAAELATYVVEKGKPFLVVVE